MSDFGCPISDLKKIYTNPKSKFRNPKFFPQGVRGLVDLF